MFEQKIHEQHIVLCGNVVVDDYNQQTFELLYQPTTKYKRHI